MVYRVKPLAHSDALFDLLCDLVLAERLDKHEDHSSVQSGSGHPAWKKSSAHDRCEVALLDVEHVGGGIESAGAIGGLNSALSVIQSGDNCLLHLPIVVVHDVVLSIK